MRQTFPKHSFELLFASLLFLLLLPPMLEDYAETLAKTGLTLVLLSSLYLTTHNRHEFGFGATIALAAILTNWGEDLLDFEYRFLFLNGLFIIFMSYICFSLLRFLVFCRHVNSDVIFAAMCLYIFIGNLWMFVYVSLYEIYPGSFILPDHLLLSDDAHYSKLLGIFSYYSFVTLTTLGYGDILPVHPAARAWVSVEAVLGQFYLAIILAKLVGLSLASRSKQ